MVIRSHKQKKDKQHNDHKKKENKLHRKLIIEGSEPHLNPGVIRVLRKNTAPATLVVTVVLLLSV